jgi:hypothetical protein
MSDWNDFLTAQAALGDPNLAATDLAAIAAAQPGLWPQVAAHPAAYPDLLEWLRSQGLAVGSQAERAASAELSEPSARQPSPFAGAQYGQTAEARDSGSSPSARRRRPVLIAVAAAAVVAVVAVVIVVASALGDRDAGPESSAPTGQPETPVEPEAPASQPPSASSSPSASAPPSDQASAPPEGPNPDGKAGSIVLVEDRDPVEYAAGETPFQGSADLPRAEGAQVGFILSADGQSLHDVSIRVVDSSLEAYGMDSLSMWTGQSFDIIDGKVLAEVGPAEGPCVLELTFDGDTASGNVTYVQSEITDFGTGPVTLTAVPTS